MATLDDLRQKRLDILRIAARHGAVNVRVFGSVARGEAGPGSDVDFLAEFPSGRGPWYGAELILDLEDLLGCKVDIVAVEELHWLIREQALREAVLL
jgi:predicted nucleotidyltransferase